MNVETCTDLINYSYIMILNIWELKDDSCKYWAHQTWLINYYDNWIKEECRWWKDRA